MGGLGHHAPSIFKITRRLVKSQPCFKRNCHSTFCDIFLLVTVAGQMVEIPHPHRKCFGTSLHGISSCELEISSAQTGK